MRAFGWAWLLIAAIPTASAADNWIGVDATHFSVLTTASKEKAIKWADTLEQFYAGMNAGLGPPAGPLPVVTVVLFRRDRDFQPYKPLEQGRPAHLGGFFVRSQDVNVIALAADNDSEELRRTIQHETVHWYFSSRPHRLPLWLEEGLAEAYSTFHLVDSTHGVFGEPIAAHLQLLKKTGLIPLEELVAMKRGEIQYNETVRTGIFYAESWLFAHYLVFGSEREPGAGLAKFEELVDKGMSPEAALRRALGADGSDLMAKLQHYLYNQNFRQAVFKLGGADVVHSVWSRRAKPGEVEVALGSILIGTRSRAEAEAHLRRAAALMPDEPRPWECLGRLALNYGDLPGASQAFAHAVERASKNYLVYYDLAITRLGFNPAALDSVPLGISGDVATSAALMRQALVLNPSDLAGYRVLAWLIANSRVATPEDTALLKKGLDMAHSDPLLAAGLAAAEIKTGQVDNGRRRLQMVIAALPGPPSAFARAILQADDMIHLIQQVDALVAAGHYAEARKAIADFEVKDPERAAADWQRLQALKAKAEPPSPSRPAGP